MVIPPWVFIVLAVLLAGLLLLRSRGRRDRLDPRFLLAHLYGSEKRLSFSQMLLNLLLILVVLGVIWYLLNAEFGGQVVRLVL